MNVVFGGTNINATVIEKIKKGEIIDSSELSPESISAGYARVSRDSRSVTELRESSSREVANARKSNEIIFFDMGHHSIAEHAYFNFDVLGISRLAIEALESHRLAGYTEKSQRYITLKGDYVTPLELSGLPKDMPDQFHRLVKKQNKLYYEALPILIEFQRQANPELAKEADRKKDEGIKDRLNREKNTLESWAKEDARYVLSMATEGQLGFSVNARELEYIIREFKFHPLAEVRGMGERFYEIASGVAPSLIILSDAESFEKRFGRPLEEKFMKEFDQVLSEECKKVIQPKNIQSRNGEVELISYTRDGDRKILTALLKKGLEKSGISIGYRDAETYASNLTSNQEEGRKFLLNIFKDLTEFDRLPREFELSTLTYRIVTSATNFAQLKRHRMMTLLPGFYDPNLGYTIPNSVIEVGFDKKYIDEMNRASELFNEIKKYNPHLAPYALTNAHRRENIVKMSVRELYAFSRLRCDKHAQWDVRNNANKMVELVKEVNPLTAMFLGGKHEFSEIRRKLYEK